MLSFIIALGILLVLVVLLWSNFSKHSSATRVPIIISVFALVVSGYNLWTTKLAPFKLHVESAGRVYLTTDLSNLKPAIKLPIVFVNSGAQMGFVYDVALRVRKNGSATEPLILAGVVEQVDQLLNLGTPPYTPPKVIPFGGFPIAGGNSVAKTILFVVYDKVPQGSLSFTTGDYSITILTKESGIDGDWREWEGIDYSVNADDEKILAGNPTVMPAGGLIDLCERIKYTASRDRSIKELVTKSRTTRDTR